MASSRMQEIRQHGDCRYLRAGEQTDSNQARRLSARRQAAQKKTRAGFDAGFALGEALLGVTLLASVVARPR
jgi:hypothetical protein